MDHVGPNHKSNGHKVWPATLWVGSGRDLMGMLLRQFTRVSLARELVEIRRSGQPVILQIDSIKSVEAPLDLYIRILTVELTHTPHFGYSTCKAPILSVVASCSLLERVVRLWQLEVLSAYWEPSSLLEHESSAWILWIPTESLWGVSRFRLVRIPTTLPQSGWFANHSKLSNHFSYVICAFTYQVVESDIVLLYIWSHVWGIIYAVGPSVVTVQTP
jgi:hypothetical protein